MLDLQDILKLSTADECIVTRYTTLTENLRWANSSTTTNGATTDDDIFIISIINKSVGVVTASVTDNMDIKLLVKQSEAAAKENPISEDYAELLPSSSYTNSQSVESTSINEILDPLQNVFKSAGKTELDIFGYAELSTTQTEMINSKGLYKKFIGRSGQIELNAKNKNRTSSIWDGQSISRWEDQKIESMYKNIVKKMNLASKKIDLDPGKYTVVLEPSAVADLLIYAYWESAARDADEGRTVFNSLKDKGKFASNDITIYSDPYETGYEYSDFVTTIASSAHESVFDNGAPINKFEWIKQGELKNLFSPRYYAKKTKRQPVYFGENLIFNSDGKSTEDLIKNVKDGLLITCLWYIREVDPQSLLLTGLTRDGVFVIKNGKIIGSTNNFRFNMSPIDMLKNVVEIGQSQRTLAREFGDYFKKTKMPPLIVKNFNMSTKSEAL